ncbi:MAG: ECF transporter S component [Chloroflexi bacterium]|nr:ECF transporter S component [Chloroflexota bacterium]
MNTNQKLRQPTKQCFRGWNTRDLLVTAVIAIAFGLLTIGVNYVSAMLMLSTPCGLGYCSLSRLDWFMENNKMGVAVCRRRVDVFT